MTSRKHDDRDEPATAVGLSQAVEFMCWSVVGLAPFLRWVNGPAVSQDQFVVQIALVSTASVGALCLRVFHLRSR